MSGESIFQGAVPRVPARGPSLKLSSSLPTLRFSEGDRAAGGSTCGTSQLPGFPLLSLYLGVGPKQHPYLKFPSFAQPPGGAPTPRDRGRQCAGPMPSSGQY